MIGFLEGKIVRSTPESVIVSTHGVGYLVHIPLTTYTAIEGLDSDATVQLFIHTHVWSDGIALYGFGSDQEKRLFEKLIGVSGIGPRLARAILSGMPANELVSALAAGDVRKLSSIPGVGKKTAERMVVDLRDKLDGFETATEFEGAAPGIGSDDLVSALTNLGYKQNVAERAVASARSELPDADFETLLRASLKTLSRA